MDVITGGSPCQDLSVAGKRAGLAGERSGLFMEQIRVIKEMRERDRNFGRSGQFIRPRYMVWENVPGTFSSNKGEDFRAVLEETVRVVDENAVIPEPPKEGWHKSGAIVGDGWSIAWRLHDAQYWGVPQRRKRLCLLADFGGSTAPEILFDAQLLRDAEDPESYEAIPDNRGESRPEIQPEYEGVSGYPESSSETREGASQGADGSADSTITIHDKATRYRGGGTGRHDDGGGNGLGIGVGTPSPAISTSERHAVMSFQERAGKPGGAREYFSKGNTLEQSQHSITNPSTALGLDAYNQQATGEVSMNLTAKRSDFHHVQTVMTNGQPTAKGEIVCAADVYNGTITGDIAASINANTGQSANHAGPSVINYNK